MLSMTTHREPAASLRTYGGWYYKGLELVRFVFAIGDWPFLTSHGHSPSRTGPMVGYVCLHAPISVRGIIHSMRGHWAGLVVTHGSWCRCRHGSRSCRSRSRDGCRGSPALYAHNDRGLHIPLHLGVGSIIDVRGRSISLVLDIIFITVTGHEPRPVG